jgi:hypothetical protein
MEIIQLVISTSFACVMPIGLLALVFGFIDPIEED